MQSSELTQQELKKSLTISRFKIWIFLAKMHLQDHHHHKVVEYGHFLIKTSMTKEIQKKKTNLSYDWIN